MTYIDNAHSLQQIENLNKDMQKLTQGQSELRVDITIFKDHSEMFRPTLMITLKMKTKR